MDSTPQIVEANFRSTIMEHEESQPPDLDVEGADFVVQIADVSATPAGKYV